MSLDKAAAPPEATAPEAPAPWGTPPPGYAAPPTGFGTPAPGYGTPPPGWGAAPGAREWNRPGMPPPPPHVSQGRDGFSVAALVLGIIPVFAGLLALIFGLIALSRIKRTRQDGRGMAIAGVVLGSFWLVAVVGLVAVGIATEADRGVDGSVTARGSVTAEGLRVGDCPDNLPEGEVQTLQLVPCSEPHFGEVFDEFDLEGEDFPGEDATIRFAEGGCAERLDAFVGAAKVDDFELYFLYPTSQSWRFGDRAVKCLLTTTTGGQLPAGSSKAP